MKGSDLTKVLNKVKAGLGDKNVIEQFGHFIFKPGHVIAYNDELCATTPIDLQMETSVDADDLQKLLKTTATSEIELKTENQKLYIKAEDGTKGALASVVEDKVSKYVESLELDAIEWLPLPAQALKGLYLCSFSASKDLTQGILTCVSVSENLICSTDTLRVSYFEMEEEMTPFLIPARSVSDIVSQPVTKYAVKNGWVYFGTEDNLILASRVLSGDYPDLTPYLEVNGEQVEFPDSVSKTISAISFMAEGEHDADKLVEISFQKGQIIAKAEKATGWVEKPAAWEGDLEFTIFANPDFMIDVLEKTSTAELGEDAILFVMDNFKHSISLK